MATDIARSSTQSVTAMSGPDQILDSESYVTTDINGSVKLRLGAEAPQNYDPVSLPSMLKAAAKKCPDHPAMCVKRNGEWVTWTYQQYLKDVETASAAFIKLGLEARCSVAIMGFNSPEWFIAYNAAVLSNSIGVGIYPTNSPDATKYIAGHCRANVIVVEDDVQLQKILKIKPDLPDLKAIVQYTGEPAEGSGALSWNQLIEMGEECQEETKEEAAKRLNDMAVNRCCGLVYTSGTTGSPKGVMVSHDNLTFTARVIGETYDGVFEGERIVSYLPLSHIAALELDMVFVMLFRGTTYFADKNALKGSLNFTLKEALPTIFLGVPRVWEKFQEKMMEIGQSNKGLRRQIGNWAKKTGLNRNKAVLEGASAKKADSLQYKMANKIVFQKLKVALGFNKTRLFLVSAAPFSLQTFEYFLSLDIRIFEIYGMSESTGPHTLNTADAQMAGSIGKTMKGVETRIDPVSGEICMQGRHVMMGYLNNPEKTEEAIEDGADGFLRSGDVGVINDDGFVSITGRIKEILITAGGENVPPVPIEDNIKQALPCVSNVIVIGDKRKFLSCLLTLKTEVDPETQAPTSKLSVATLKWLAEHADITDAVNVEDLLGEAASASAGGSKAFNDAIQAGIAEANKKAVSNAQKVQKFAFVERDFSVSGGELGPTLKLKRHVVIKQYESLIESFYNN